MARLYNGNVDIWLYTDADRAIWSWVDGWARTPQWINDNGEVETSKIIKKVFATPDRAFGMMRKILGNSNVPSHEAPIPLPFYSITRLDPIFDPRRDLAAFSIRAWRARQLKCPVCDLIVSLEDLNNGICPYCAAVITEANIIKLNYDISSKTEEEALEDEWSYEGSTEVPRPYTVTYQFDLWCRTLGEAMYQHQEFERNFMHGYDIIEVEYPEPFRARDCLLDNPTNVNNSDLEPGEEEVKIRYSFTVDLQCWLPPRLQRTTPVKELTIEYHNLDGSVTFEIDEDVFEND